MRTIRTVALAALAVLCGSAPATAAPDGWHGSLKDGLEASAKSGKPLLLISAWARKL